MSAALSDASSASGDYTVSSTADSQTDANTGNGEQQMTQTSAGTFTTEIDTQNDNSNEVEKWENTMEQEAATQDQQNEMDKEDEYGINNEVLNEACGQMDWSQFDTQPNTQTRTNKRNEWIKVHKKRSTVIHNSEETDTRVTDSVRAIMRQRGDKAVEAATNKDTPVQVEFKVKNTTKSFNLREALGKLLTTMLSVDASIKIQNNEGSTEWNDPNELPVGSAMEDHFIIRQDTPMYETPKVTIYFTVKSTLTVNAIKYDPQVITYLKTYNIFLRPDRFQSSKVRSPGYFVNIAPRLVWKQDFNEELKTAMRSTKFD